MKITAIPLILITVLSLFSTITPPVKADWCYTTKITIDHTKIESDLTNFPVLVYLNSSRVGNWANIKDDLSDLIFVDSTQKITLDAEIEAKSNNDYAYIWVKIPYISSTVDTYFYIHYGNTVVSNWDLTGAVWDPDAVLVSHMNNIVGYPKIRDSSGYLNVINKKSNFEPLQVDGKIALAQYFDGADDYGLMPTSASLETITTTNQFTLGLWYNYNGTLPEWSHHMPISTEGLKIYLSLFGDHSTTSVFVNGLQYTIDCAFYPSVGEWNSLYLKYDGQTISAYNNGVADPTHYDITDGWLSYNGRFEFGMWKTLDLFKFPGTFDETRLYNVGKSDGWIKANYYSESDQLLSYSEYDIYSPINAPSGLYLILALLVTPLLVIVIRKKR